MVRRKTWSWKYRCVSSIAPQTHQYRSLVLAGVSWGLSSRKTPFLPWPWGVSCPSANPLRSMKRHLSWAQPAVQAHFTCKHICSVYAHMCGETTTHVCVCRVLSTHELMSCTQERTLFTHQVWRCQWRNAASCVGAGLTSLSVCGEPELALGFLRFIQRWGASLQAVAFPLRRVKPASPHGHRRGLALMLPLCSPKKSKSKSGASYILHGASWKMKT